MRIELRRGARIDLEEIAAYGAERWGAARTRDYLNGLRDAIRRLSDHPHLGRARPELVEGLRSLRYRDYLVFYAARGGAIDIVAVLHERRNHAALDFADRLSER